MDGSSVRSQYGKKKFETLNSPKQIKPIKRKRNLLDIDMKTVYKKKILYHLSFNNLGREVIFKPRIPSNRFEGEGTYHPFKDEFLDEDDSIKRICVSNSIKGAYIALEGDGYTKNKEYKLFLYCPENPKAVSRDMPLIMVPDAKQTGEHWILEKTKMICKGEILFKNGNWKWIKKYEN